MGLLHNEHSIHKINYRTYRNVEKYSEGPELLNHRIAVLREEWSAERILLALLSIVSLTGLLLTYFYDFRWIFLPGIIMLILLQHAFFERSLLSPLLRKCGIRTRQEIDEERNALKALRGDYGHVGSPAEALEDSIKS